MTRTRLLILSLVVLDAMGIGVVFPTLPELLHSFGMGSDLPRQYGLLLATYAFTSFLASPALGALSDRWGRRPILLFSLLGTALDDLVMATARSLPVLYGGRALAGLTGANLTVLNACLADSSSPEERAAAFGQLNACFGLGFIAGPVLGGLAGSYSPRAPFYVAAVLNLLGALLSAWQLPETIPARSERPMTLAGFNPFAAYRNMAKLRGVGSWIFVTCSMELVGQVPASLWVIYGTARFGWTPVVVGLSFAAFGLVHAIVQVLLPKRLERWTGEWGSIMTGIGLDSFGYCLYSLVRTTFQAFSVLPVLCLGGVALPAVQALSSRSVDEDRQGELQGVLTSSISLVAVAGPIAAASLYQSLRNWLPGYPGAIWIAPIVLYLPTVFVLLKVRKHVTTPASRPEGEPASA